MADGRPTTPTS